MILKNNKKIYEYKENGRKDTSEMDERCQLVFRRWAVTEEEKWCWQREKLKF